MHMLAGPVVVGGEGAFFNTSLARMSHLAVRGCGRIRQAGRQGRQSVCESVSQWVEESLLSLWDCLGQTPSRKEGRGKYILSAAYLVVVPVLPLASKFHAKVAGREWTWIAQVTPGPADAFSDSITSRTAAAMWQLNC